MDELKHKAVLEAEFLLGDQGNCSAVPAPADQGEAVVVVPPTAKKKEITGKLL